MFLSVCKYTVNTLYIKTKQVKFALFKNLYYLCRVFSERYYCKVCLEGMSKNLVIVESPAKAKTIEKFLGNDYHVLSSQGHVRDISGVGKNSIGIDFAHNYAPHYTIEPSKLKIIDSLKKATKEAEHVWLASDEDREGEAIAWHLKEVLHLSEKDTKRIVFHEITPTAIKEAILHPRDIDYNLVDAQQARRVLDRIVGFEVSPLLWKKITPGLSAGRVQSVAVRLIVEREREIDSFTPVSQYRVVADFMGNDMSGKKQTLHTELNHRFSSKQEAMAFLEQCENTTFSIGAVVKRPTKRTPAPPFTTSSLQQEAARKLHFPVSKTMRVAQTLYEAGHITYMRTDSLNLSSFAISTTKQQILSDFGEQYHKTRNFHTTAKGAQEAHEAIRPTYVDKRIAGSNEDERRLYELIWKRTVASQMADAQLETTRIEVASPDFSYVFVATGDVVLFDGFMKVYVQSTDDEADDETKLLPRFQLSAPMSYEVVLAQQSFTKAPLRYTEASLVKKMEELGIGRPSTYASIIETIQQRNYVVRGAVEGHRRSVSVLSLKDNKITESIKQETYGADSGKLLPTDLGRVTNDFLVKAFPDILNYDFTAEAENAFDDVAAGKVKWVNMVDKFYKAFHPAVEAVPAGKVEGRMLGTEPKTGRAVVAKLGKMGPCIQIGLSSDEEKPLFASLKPGQSIYTITLPEALELFNTPYPYELGQFEGETLVVNDGRFGPYIRQGKTFFSIPKTADAQHLTLKEAVEIIQKKRQALVPIHDFGDLQVLNGRFGPYIKYKDMNYRLPKAVDVSTLTEKDCRELVENTKPTGAKTKRTASGGQKTATQRKTGKKTK